jgi:hypothetical protein
MTAAQNILAGLGITAAMIRGIAPNSVVKAAPETRPNTTITADDALVLSLDANTQWVFLSMVGYNGAAFTGGGIQGGLADAWNLPAGASALWTCLGYGSGTSMVLNLGQLSGAGAGAFSHNSNGTGENLPLIYAGLVQIGNTPGGPQYAWGQAAANATVTTVVAGSWLAAWQVG